MVTNVFGIIGVLVKCLLICFCFFFCFYQQIEIYIYIFIYIKWIISNLNLVFHFFLNEHTSFMRFIGSITF